ncbi:Ribosome biogenesis protein BRX1 homolog 2-like protein [Drosera capensis]
MIRVLFSATRRRSSSPAPAESTTGIGTLMLNLVSLLPHCKKDNKVESKGSKGGTLNELVELKSCSSKYKDLYLWMVKCPSGPPVKFLSAALEAAERDDHADIWNSKGTQEV